MDRFSLTQTFRRMFLLSFALLTTHLWAQHCPPHQYLTRVFDSVTVDADVLYGSAIGYNADTVNLFMDVYEPYGDTSSLRPLIVWVHGGGFYGGNRQVGEITRLCDTFARKGLVTATISYRLGFWGANDAILTGKRQPPYCFDNKEIVRAIYRAMQDTRGAIRYLKGAAAAYRIDTTRVYIGGVSAGGFTALHVAYLDQESEKPAAADSLNPVIHTDLFGNVILNRPRPDLGPVQGELNLNGHSASVAGCINIYGGLIDTSLISSPKDVPLFSYHILDDPLVSCYVAQPFHGVAILGTLHPVVFGPCMIKARMDHLGMVSDCHETHIRTSDIFGSPPRTPHTYTSDAPYVFANLGAYMSRQLCNRVAVLSQPVSQQLSVNDPATLEVTASGPDLAYQWFLNGLEVNGATDSLLSIAAVQLSDSGSYQCRVTDACGRIAWSDVAQLSIQGATGIASAISAGIRLMPNPTSGTLVITGQDQPVDEVEVLDLAGRRVAVFVGTAKVDLGSLPSGLYVLKVTIGERQFIDKVRKQ